MLFLVGCADSPASVDGGADLARIVTDSGVSDAATGGKDAAPGGGAEHKCTVASDCRLFFSTCGECQCYAIRADEIDPVCNKNPNNCFQNTCTGKVAVCNAGMCALP